MPFKSKSQIRTCYGTALKNIDKGEKITWDCDKWSKETKNPELLPNYLYGKGRSVDYDKRRSVDYDKGRSVDYDKRRSVDYDKGRSVDYDKKKCLTSKKCSRGSLTNLNKKQICTGPRGGKYIIRSCQKIYIPKNLIKKIK